MNLVEGRRRMAVRQSDLYSSLWASCDKLGGGPAAPQDKDYVLVLLFVKYVFDRYSADPNGDLVFPEGGGFGDLDAAKNDPEIGDRINTVAHHNPAWTLGSLVAKSDASKRSVNDAPSDGVFCSSTPSIRAWEPRSERPRSVCHLRRNGASGDRHSGREHSWNRD